MSKGQLPRLPLKAEYHDGDVVAVELGPRHEVVLTIRLDPVWNDGNAAERRIRFSKVKNFEEVTEFFRRLGPAREPGDSLDVVLAIVRPRKGTVGVDLASLGFVELRGAEVKEL